MRCPHCLKSFDYQDCLTEPGAEPRDGDIGICYGCGGWWAQIEGCPHTYTPTREEMEGAYAQLSASRERFVEEEKRQFLQSAKRRREKATMTTTPLRPELDQESMPKRMRTLPVDDRGYPVPWFVDYVNGKPEFRAMDWMKYRRAIKERLCWVCGQPLGRNMAFVAGPMCGINRTSAEPPSHADCARWSAKNCPFLANPRAVRREDELVNNPKLVEQAAGNAICRNPGVAMVWICRGYEIFNDGKGGALIAMGEPESVEWYREGRLATRAEVQESIEQGLPALEMVAQMQGGAMDELRRYEKRLDKWLPLG